MTVYIAINAAHRTPVEIESLRWATTSVEGYKLSSFGDRIVTVWSAFDMYAAEAQAQELWDKNVAAVIFETPEEVGVYVQETFDKLPAAWK